MTIAARAIAHPNIALAKYWGKRPWGHNLPAVPSLSVTLAGMATTTEVCLGAEADTLELDDEEVAGRPLARVSALLDLLWQEGARSGERPKAKVRSRNDFPTAAGLASSASAFAALAVAGNEALATGLPPEHLSCIARRVSASAGRSLFGGYVELLAGEEGQLRLPARPVAPADHWDLRLVVAVTTEGKKEIGSTEGMNHTAETSPLYPAWVDGAEAIFRRVRSAVLERDLEALGAAAEHSALTMHASALAADPGLLYWNDVTFRVMKAVRRAREEGLPAWFTIDAGPHVKVLTTPQHEADVERLVRELPGVLRAIDAKVGGPARVVNE